MAGYKNSGVLSLHFNQDQGCFVCCMETGLRIYNVDPLVEKARYDIDTMGSIKTAEMLWRSNVIAVVGGGRAARFAENTVLLYDDIKKEFIIDINFPDPVKTVRLRKDKLIVAQEKEIHIFSFPKEIKRLLTVKTRDNPKGLIEVATLTSAQKKMLAFPGHKTGSLQLLDLDSLGDRKTGTPITIDAHIGELACIAMNNGGTKVATASTTGTLIRVWCTIKREKLIELRRGSDQANFYCMNFSKDSEYLVASSDKGTVHIFAVKNEDLNRKYQLSTYTSYFSTYMASQYSFASFTIPPESACICAFSSKSTVIAVCVDGTFHEYNFSTDGECNRKSYGIYLDLNADDEY